MVARFISRLAEKRYHAGAKKVYSNLPIIVYFVSNIGIFWTLNICWLILVVKDKNNIKKILCDKLEYYSIAVLDIRVTFIKIKAKILCTIVSLKIQKETDRVRGRV